RLPTSICGAFGSRLGVVAVRVPKAAVVTGWRWLGSGVLTTGSAPNPAGFTGSGGRSGGDETGGSGTVGWRVGSGGGIGSGVSTIGDGIDAGTGRRKMCAGTISLAAGLGRG